MARSHVSADGLIRMNPEAPGRGGVGYHRLPLRPLGMPVEEDDVRTLIMPVGEASVCEGRSHGTKAERAVEAVQVAGNVDPPISHVRRVQLLGRVVELWQAPHPGLERRRVLWQSGPVWGVGVGRPVAAGDAVPSAVPAGPGTRIHGPRGALKDVVALDVGLQEVRPAVAPVVGGHERQPLVIILAVHLECQRHLLRVGQARRGKCLLARLREDREENRGQDRDDRDHHEQLDERKAPSPSHLRYSPYWFRPRYLSQKEGGYRRFATLSARSTPCFRRKRLVSVVKNTINLTKVYHKLEFCQVNYSLLDNKKDPDETDIGASGWDGDDGRGHGRSMDRRRRVPRSGLAMEL